MANPTFGTYLRAWRKGKGLTQEALAKKLEVSQGAVTDWEREESRPAPPTLIALADLIEVHPRVLTALPTKLEETPADSGHGFSGEPA